MLKGIDELNTYLTNWLIAHNFDATAELGMDFEVNLATNRIFYALVVSEEADEIFTRVCAEIHAELADCDSFYLSFFHEIGHIETENEWTDKEWKKYRNFVERSTSLNNYEEYFYNPIEYAATCWGCDYIVNHREEIEDFSKNVNKLISKIFKKNHIIDE